MARDKNKLIEIMITSPTVCDGQRYAEPRDPKTGKLTAFKPVKVSTSRQNARYLVGVKKAKYVGKAPENEGLKTLTEPE